MDLLALMKNEIETLHLKDEVAIVDHLYRRTGEIFDYDSRFEFEPKEKKLEIINEDNQKEINICNIEEFEILCTRWAKIFVELLKSFHIKAEIVPTFTKHPYIRVFLSNGRIIIADLMIGLEDLKNIKFGKRVQNLYYEDDKTKNNIMKNENLEQNEAKLKNYLDQKKWEIEKKGLSDTEKLYQYFKVIETVMNVLNANVRYSSGSEIIFDLLFYFLRKRYLNYAEFYNIEKNKYIRIYSVQRNSEWIYFSYEEHENGCFQFQEKRLEEMESLLETDFYKKQRTMYLNLPKAI